MSYAVGVDIGGTKIAVGLIDETGKCLYQNEVPSHTRDKEALFDRVVDSISVLLKKTNMTVQEMSGIGIGVPGKVDVRQGVALKQNNVPWENFPVVQRVQDYFHIENVIIDNDVFMAAYAEWMALGGQLDETFVYMTLSTGISCCMIHNGQTIRGSGFSGEIGFLPVSQEGSQVRTLEAAASGPGIVRRAAQQLEEDGVSVSEDASALTTQQVIDDFKKGEAYAEQTMNDTFDDWAKGIYSIETLLDPHHLVLGGGVIHHHPDLLPYIKKSLEAFLVPDQQEILHRMSVSRWRGNAGIIGAGLKSFSQK